MTGALALNDTGTATTDSLTINNSATAADDMFNSENLTLTGFETLNVVTTNTGGATTQAAGYIALTADTGGTTTVNFSGNSRVTAAAITANVIDASGLDAQGNGLTFVQSAAAVGVTSIVGSEGADTLLGDAASTISGGGGNDGITGGTGNDTLNGGAGNDTITTNSGNDTVDGGAGDDTIVFAGNLATGDTIVAGDGTDTLSITNASLTTLAGYGVTAANTLNGNISGLERVLISNSFDSGTAFDVGRLDAVNYLQVTGITGNESFTGFASGSTVELLADQNATTDILTLGVNGAATSTTDTLNVTLSVSGNTNFGVASIADVETINLNVSEATASTTVRAQTLDLTVTQQLNTAGTADLADQSLIITGTESLTIGTATAVDTIDASGMTVAATTDAGLTMSAAHTAAQTITGSGKVDVLRGSTGADTITAGAGNDTIHGNTGADTIDAGAGTDTYVNTGMVAATIEGAGTGTSTGIAINLGTTAVTGAAITSLSSQFIAGSLSTIGAGQVGYLFATESSNFSSAVDTVSNFENIDLSGANGRNYVVGSAAANTITSGSGADVVTGGAGADTFVSTLTSSVAATAHNLGTAGTAVIATGETVTFGSGVDIITDFTAGTGGDVLDTVNGSAAVTGIGKEENALTADTSYFLSGAYVASTGVFTVAADGAGADTLIFEGGNAGDASLDVTTNASWIVLQGVDSGDLVAANFA